MNFLSDLIINPSTVGHAVGQFYVKVDALGKVVKTVDVQETDPTVSSFIKTITTGNINSWNQAFNWGNHASANYLINTNDRNFITDSRGSQRLPDFYDDRYAQWDFQNSNDTLAGGDGWHGVLTVAKWTEYQSSHRQEQLIFTGNDLKRRTAISNTSWGNIKTIWDSGNLDPSNFVLSAHLLKTGDTLSGKITVASTTNRRAGMYGLYSSTKLGHIWSMGAGYQISDDGTSLGNIYGMAYAHSNSGLTPQSGHQTMFVSNGLVGASIEYQFGRIWTRSTGNSTEWNQAYIWGNHLGLYSVINHTHSFSQITNRPTTISGYGITDAQPLGNYSAVINNITQIPARSYNDLQNLPALNFEPSFSKNTGFNRNFGIVVNTVAEGNDSRILNGQTAFGWGNHLGLYHLTSWTPTWEQVSGKPVFTRTLTGLVPFSGGSGTTRFLREDGNWAIPPSNGGDTTPSHVNSITTGDISKWNQAFNWGNHAGLYSLSAHSHSFLVGSGGLTTQAGSNTLLHTGQIGNPSVGLFPAINNANSIITVNRHPGDYYSQLGFSSNGNMYFRSFSNVAINTTETWRTVWDSGNFNPNSYAIAASAITNVALTASSLTLTRASGNLTASIPTWNQNTTGNSATSTLAANSVLLAGLEVNTGRNSNPNKIVRTNTSGYVDFGWINTTSGPPNSIASGLNRIYCSDDAYIRYLTPAQFSISLGLITSNNISSQSVFSSINASSLVGTGTITRTSAGTSYVNCIQVRELNNNMAQNSDPNARPQLAFHWGGIVASNIALEPSGRIAIVNNPGTGYEAFVCAGFTATTGNFSSNVNANTYDVIPGDGNGIRFWQSDNYKISMGVTSQYRYGTVTDYSIKTQMNFGNGGRGFTWGTLNNTPIASLNATSGDMQIAGNFTSLGGSILSGNLINFLTPAGNALPISTNNLLVSNSYSHRSRVPTNGMYVLGNIISDGDLAAFISSDRRLKDNVLTIKDSLMKINMISGYTFDWNKNQTTYNGSDYGIIAQEIEAVFPEMVTTRENGYKAVKYDRLIPVLIEAIKELNNEVKRLKNS